MRPLGIAVDGLFLFVSVAVSIAFLVSNIDHVAILKERQHALGVVAPIEVLSRHRKGARRLREGAIRLFPNTTPEWPRRSPVDIAPRAGAAQMPPLPPLLENPTAKVAAMCFLQCRTSANSIWKYPRAVVRRRFCPTDRPPNGVFQQRRVRPALVTRETLIFAWSTGPPRRRA